MAKGLFPYRGDSIYRDRPFEFYRFPSQYLSRAKQFVGDWVVYMEPVKAGRRGYHAVAKLKKIVPDPEQPGMWLALIDEGSYVPLGKDVPFRSAGEVVEKGVLNGDGKVSGRARSAVRPLSDSEFDRILRFGLVEEQELLPRVSAVQTSSLLHEDHSAWEGPVDRETQLISRSVRNRQFRLRVLNAYDGRCALTGMKLVNGGGRLETEAAHIMSVGAGGPDHVTNGIALSGTVHWMFDRGLIGMSDSGEILLSSKINDRQSVEKIIYPDLRARWPDSVNLKPNPTFLTWHREHFCIAA